MLKQLLNSLEEVNSIDGYCIIDEKMEEDVECDWDGFCWKRNERKQYNDQ